MGSSESTPQQPPVNHNAQSNGNEFRNIDQSTGAAWLQFNWASFGGGISTVIIICVLLVALWIALKYNRKANKKARRAELHELLLLSSRHHRIYDQQSSKEPSQPVRPSSGYPGMSSVAAPTIPSRERGYEGYPGFLAWEQLQRQQLQQLQHLQYLQQLPASHFSNLPSGLSSAIPAQQSADWSRIREIPVTPARSRVSFADVHEPPRSRTLPAAPSGSPTGPPQADPTVYDTAARGVANSPDSIAAIVERLDQAAPQ